jgi:hypothetical protein
MNDMGRMAAIATAASSSDAVQPYRNAVNALCDELEQKIIALNGGKFDIPLKDFLAQLKRHTKLRDDFDRRLAAIVVPKAAATEAQALADYIAFANKLDAARLRTARQGVAAYQLHPGPVRCLAAVAAAARSSRQGGLACHSDSCSRMRR